MTYRLTPERSLARQLPQLLEKELAAAVEWLADSAPEADAIHEARRSVKKARALLRLVRQAVGTRFDREDRRLRLAAHTLSELRDADASGETLELLRREYAGVLQPAVVRGIARGLSARIRLTRSRARLLVPRARQALEASLRSAPRVIQPASRFRTVRSGMTRAYDHARTAFLALDHESGAGQFHLWRRRVKDHWYQMRLLAGLHREPRARAGILKQLEEILGEDHNLALLRGLILAAPDRYGDARATALLLGCIAKRQHGLRTRAMALGELAFDAKPAKFRRSVTKWWLLR